jgi:hypothetical protein
VHCGTLGMYVLADRKYHVCNDYSIRRLGWNCTGYVNQLLTDNVSIAWAGNTREQRMQPHIRRKVVIRDVAVVTSQLCHTLADSLSKLTTEQAECYAFSQVVGIRTPPTPQPQASVPPPLPPPVR